jgi:dTMP kinase
MTMAALFSPGRLITFEGGDGVGKSLQQNRLAQRLQQAGLAVLCTREPGGTPLAEEIRQLLLHGANSVRSQESELLLLLAARADHLQQRILPALQQGTWVLCDRFVDSTWAYQGHGRGMDLAWLELCHQRFCGNVLPDRTLLLDLDPQIGLQRSRKRAPAGQQADHFEQQHLSFHQRVRSGFLQLAAQHAARIRIIDATRSIEQTTDQIWEEIRVLLPNP